MNTHTFDINYTKLTRRHSKTRAFAVENHEAIQVAQASKKYSSETQKLASATKKISEFIVKVAQARVTHTKRGIKTPFKMNLEEFNLLTSIESLNTRILARAGNEILLHQAKNSGTVMV